MNVVGCSNCGREFEIADRAHGFSHCDNHSSRHPLPEGDGEPAAPAAELPALQSRLLEEFMAWWPTSVASTKYRPLPKAGAGHPISNWLNVEDFLTERYPPAATNSHAGEEALGALNMLLKSGESLWGGEGNHITAAMLGLHNQVQGRTWRDEDDERRYLDFMLRQLRPETGKEP